MHKHHNVKAIIEQFIYIYHKIKEDSFDGEEIALPEADFFQKNEQYFSNH